MSNPALAKLRLMLEKLRSGPLSEDDRDDVLRLLEDAWSELQGASRATKMKPAKVRRAESLEWHPPILSFRLERHGGAVMGSKRGELQQWTVDLADETASFCPAGYRNLHKPAPRFEARKCAKNLSQQLEDGRPGVKWITENSVQIIPTKVVPNEGAAAQTIRERRKRFRAEMIKVMSEQGWINHSKARSPFLTFTRGEVGR
jgi:hypothetical protein